MPGSYSKLCSHHGSNSCKQNKQLYQGKSPIRRSKVMASEQLFIHFSHLWKTMRKCYVLSDERSGHHCRGQWSNTMKQSGNTEKSRIHSLLYIHSKEDFVTWLPKWRILSGSDAGLNSMLRFSFLFRIQNLQGV